MNYPKITQESTPKQTTNRFAIYFYDDEAQDHPGALIQDHIPASSSHSKPFKVIYQKETNLGVNPAHLRGYKVCNPPFLMWLGAGDFLVPYFFACFESLFQENPQCTWLKANIYFANPKGNQARFANGRQTNPDEWTRQDGLMPRLILTEHDAITFQAYRESAQQYSVRNFFFENRYKKTSIFFSRLKKMLGHGKLPSFYFWNRSVYHDHCVTSIFSWRGRTTFRKRGETKA